jgi:hypothetical protein
MEEEIMKIGNWILAGIFAVAVLLLTFTMVLDATRTVVADSPKRFVWTFEQRSGSGYQWHTFIIRDTLTDRCYLGTIPNSGLVLMPGECGK